MMVIKKVHNNNVATVLDKKGQENVVIGRGVGFEKKPGDQLDESCVEKIFHPQVFGEQERFEQLINEIPIEVLSVSEHIEKLANRQLGISLSSSTYLALADHIHQAVMRVKRNQFTTNMMIEMIGYFYPDEFQLAREALPVIEHAVGTKLPIDEAGFITLHLVNAAQYGNMTKTMAVVDFLSRTVNIIEETLQLELDANSPSYLQLVSQLKFFFFSAQKSKAEPSDNQMLNTLELNFPTVAHCADLLSDMMKAEFDISLTQKNRADLMLIVLPLINQ